MIMQMKEEFHMITKVKESKVLSNCQKLLALSSFETKKEVKTLMTTFSSINEPTDGKNFFKNLCCYIY